MLADGIVAGALFTILGNGSSAFGAHSDCWMMSAATTATVNSSPTLRPCGRFPAGGSRQALSFNGQLTGFHAHIIGIDDAHNILAAPTTTRWMPRQRRFAP